MAERISARLTAKAGREFGLTVGGAFVALAAFAWWREHPYVSASLATLGAALILAGLTIPTRLGPAERAWMRLAHIISKVTTPVVMGVMYLVVITPVGLAKRMTGSRPLTHVADERGFWKTREPGQRRSRSMRRQF